MGYKYVLHIINYFSQYFTTYLSVTVNTSDVIQALKDLFNQFMQLVTFFLNWGQHFENSVVEKYIKK